MAPTSGGIMHVTNEYTFLVESIDHLSYEKGTNSFEFGDNLTIQLCHEDQAKYLLVQLAAKFNYELKDKEK
jgi:hypothetical protein